MSDADFGQWVMSESIAEFIIVVKSKTQRAKTVIIYIIQKILYYASTEFRV